MDPGNLKDGMASMFGCRWENEICYQGPPPTILPFGECICYAGFFCWRECKGRWVVEGEKAVCWVDGADVGCQKVPTRDEWGRVVLCRYGVVPWDWPLSE